MTSSSISNSVKTELLTLNDVYKRGLGFLIPSYQRPYVWKAEDVIKLFQDIKMAFKSKEEQYFIGSALTARRDNEGMLELIDGQQRITTLMLISIAFKNLKANALKAKDLKDKDKDKNPYIPCILDKVSDLNGRPRLSFEIRESVSNLLGSFAGLDNSLRPSDEEIKQDEYLRPLAASLHVLSQQFEKLNDEKFDLIAFANYISNQVVWVNNIVPADMDLNRLFSNMNTAGLQLEPVDLLKARLLKKIKTEKGLYNKIWLACQHLDNYFERNLRQLFKVNWKNTIKYGELSEISKISGWNTDNKPKTESVEGKSVAELMKEANANDPSETTAEQMLSDGTEDIDTETVYCKSIVSFELLLIHTLRIFCVSKGWNDLKPQIKAGNLLACFDVLLKQNENETEIKDFIELLWQVRYQFDTWVVKWVKDDDSEDSHLRLTNINNPSSDEKNDKKNCYINRTAKELSNLVQLQAVRYFTGDSSAQYWLTALLGRLINQPNMNENEVLAILEQLDNDLSLTSDTQKEASFKIAKGMPLEVIEWDGEEGQQKYFESSLGTSFEHYWFQKLEYLLWKQGDKNDEKLKTYRITSKNSVEHVHPQNEEYHRQLDDDLLNSFGNLVLLSPGENSSYSNQTVAKKKADFDSKPRYDALKLKDIFETYTEFNNEWTKSGIEDHQKKMLALLKEHYT